MHLAWGALKGAVQEFNQVLMAASDEEAAESAGESESERAPSECSAEPSARGAQPSAPAEEPSPVTGSGLRGESNLRGGESSIGGGGGESSLRGGGESSLRVEPMSSAPASSAGPSRLVIPSTVKGHLHFVKTSLMTAMESRLFAPTERRSVEEEATSSNYESFLRITDELPLSPSRTEGRTISPSRVSLPADSPPESHRRSTGVQQLPTVPTPPRPRKGSSPLRTRGKSPNKRPRARSQGDDAIVLFENSSQLLYERQREATEELSPQVDERQKPVPSEEVRVDELPPEYYYYYRERAVEPPPVSDVSLLPSEGVLLPEASTAAPEVPPRPRASAAALSPDLPNEIRPPPLFWEGLGTTDLPSKARLSKESVIGAQEQWEAAPPSIGSALLAGRTTLGEELRVEADTAEAQAVMTRSASTLPRAPENDVTDALSATEATMEKSDEVASKAEQVVPSRDTWRALTLVETPTLSSEFVESWKRLQDKLTASSWSDHDALELHALPFRETKDDLETLCLRLASALLRSSQRQQELNQEMKEQWEAKDVRIASLCKEVADLNEHLTLVTDKAAQTFQRYQNEVEEQTLTTLRLHQQEVQEHSQPGCVVFRKRYDTLMEQLKRLRQDGKDARQRSMAAESNESSLFEQIERLELDNEDLAEQLESWQRAHAQVSENQHKLSAELLELRTKYALLESAMEELDIARRTIAEQEGLLNRLRAAEIRLRETETHFRESVSDLEEKKHVIHRLNRLIEDSNADHETTVNALQRSLQQSQRLLREALERVATLEDNATQIQLMRDQFEALRKEFDQKQAAAEESAKHNAVLSDAVQKLLTRVHAAAEEQEHFIDRRDVIASLKDYYALLQQQGVVNVMGGSKDEMIFVLSEALSLPLEVRRACLGLSESSESTVRRTRLAHRALQADGEALQEMRRPLTALFLEFLESEATR